MKLQLLYFGRGPAWTDVAVSDYARRMPFLSLSRVRDSPKQTQFERMSRLAGRSSISIMLDERGKQVTTQELASMLQQWRLDASDVSFMIGDSNGFSDSERNQADFLWSLSSLTLPYALSRLIVCEQLYRAHSILTGHPYHRHES